MNKVGVLSLGILLIGGTLSPSLAQVNQEPVQTAQKQVASQAFRIANASQEKRRAHTTKGFSLIPPAGWNRSTAKKSKYIMVYKAKPKNKFSINLNVSANPDKGVVIKSIGPVLKKQFAKQFKKWKLGEEGYMTVDGQKAYYLSSKFSMSGFDIQNLQLLVKNPKRKLFYIATFTSRAADYKANRAKFMQALKTIRFD